MITLEEVLAGAGPALLARVTRGPAPAVVTDVVVADLGTDDVGAAGDLVLGIGLTDPASAVELVRRGAEREVAAVVLPTRLTDDPAVRRLAEGVGIWLLAVPTDVSWVQLVWTLRGVVEWPAVVGDHPDGGVVTDLFAVADAVAAIIDAPVTIEDSQSRVLAYSRGQDAGDPVRHSTIVGRRVPAPVLAHFRGQGVFRRLTTSGEPFFVPAEDDVRARFIFPVRAGEEWLGSIWAVVDEPVPADRVADVDRIAAALAVHLLRLRAQADLARRTAEVELARLLQESDAAAPTLRPALERAPWRVVVLSALYGDGGDPRRSLELWRSILRRHGWSEPRLCLLHGRVHAVVGDRDDSAAGGWPWLARLVTDLHAGDRAYAAAAGEVARGTADLSRSCAQAGEAYAVLGDRAAVAHEATWAARVVQVAAAAIAGRPAGPLAALADHDAAHGTSYVVTLAAHLRHPGRPRAAAAELGIHPNTLRQRMARVTVLLDADLEDPEVRLALQLQVSAMSGRPR